MTGVLVYSEHCRDTCGSKAEESFEVLEIVQHGKQLLISAGLNYTHSSSMPAIVGERFGTGSALSSRRQLLANLCLSNQLLEPRSHKLCKMSSSKAALLIGNIAHSRKEWEALSSLATLKVLPNSFE